MLIVALTLTAILSKILIRITIYWTLKFNIINIINYQSAKEKSMKVAIWGSYCYGNYGDDVMALLFAKVLKNLDVTPYVYRLDKSLADKYSVKTTNSLDELFQDARFCIIGGGGLLTGRTQKRNTKKNKSSFDLVAEKNNDFHNLHLMSSNYNCPVFPISVGGDGRGADTPLASSVSEFWQGFNCKISTVRLKEDIALVNELGKEAIYYPDVLWTTSDFWNIPLSSKSNDKIHVGINIPKSLKNSVLAFSIKAITKIRKDIVFHFIRTMLPNSPRDYELLPNINSSYIKHHVYKDPQSTLEFLNSLDLIVSSKLHVGLTALSLGIPFISFNGAGKTQTFLKSVNADFAIYSSQERLKLLKLISNPEKIIQAKTKFDFATMEELKKSSRGHLDFVQKLVNEKNI